MNLQLATSQNLDRVTRLVLANLNDKLNRLSLNSPQMF